MVERPSVPWLTPRAAYLHIPFCAHHCGYCDFAVTAGQDHLIELYLDAVGEELKTLVEPKPVRTIFLGGGTPTYLTACQLERLLQTINRWFPCQERTEFSIESTPDSLTAEKLAVLAAGGVTRVSVGVQSFQAESLSALDRLHRTEHIPVAVNLVREAGLDLSLDLIFAAPGATLESWSNDLEQAIGYEPSHLSTYGLTYETGTPLWKQRRAGEVIAVPEETELAMLELAIDRLTAAGYEHYEVSNFAKPGKRCEHNETYWANEAYYGFGVGAARYVQGSRELNVRNTNDYIRKVLSGESPTFQRECLNDRDRAFETIGVQLRRIAGIDKEQFARQTGFSLDSLVDERLRSLIAHGLLSDDGQTVRLTRRGFCVADAIIVDLMKANHEG
jgi:oxygen-independent coproporphyrinogen-3 oxidase